VDGADEPLGHAGDVPERLAGASDYLALARRGADPTRYALSGVSRLVFG
jgi:hypothetical protein